MPKALRFTWDETKRQRNLRKHGIDFEDAKRVISTDHIVDYDLAHSQRQDRWRAMGEVSGRVIVVGYQDVDRTTVRLFTARPATKSETIRYYAETFGEPAGGGRKRGKRKH